MNEVRKTVGRIRKCRDIWELKVSCPYCMEYHHHGAGSIKNPPMHKIGDVTSRAAHCSRDGIRSGNYDIEIIQVGNRKF